MLDTISAAITFQFACLRDCGHFTMPRALTAVSRHWIEPSDGAVGVICVISMFCFHTIVTDKYVLVMK
jgi:hypothetical protein